MTTSGPENKFLGEGEWGLKGHWALGIGNWLYWVNFLKSAIFCDCLMTMK